MRNVLLPIATIWWREIIRFFRQRSRLFSAIAQPLVFWILIGSGLNASFQPAGVSGKSEYIEYFYPGIVVLVLLFTAIFATISVVNERREGFLQGVLVAPAPRWGIVLGQALGGTTLALLQGVLLLFIAPLTGIRFGLTSLLSTLGVMTLLAFGLTNLGLLIAWRMDSTQGFHAVMNLILIPIWLLSGAFFPSAGAPDWLAWVMKLNPLTYGVDAFRRSLYFDTVTTNGNMPTWTLSILVISLFCFLTYLGATLTASAETNKKHA
ncbi:MAG: ABC transporter permease [Candidatus Poribacteria bacterium]|nr:ABC transporter permease [Candidatus Poribacteria bacterium]